MRRLTAPKWVRGGVEGPFVTSLSFLLTDAVITAFPWFDSRRSDLLIVVGVLVGSLIHHFASRYLWSPSNA